MYLYFNRLITSFTMREIYCITVKRIHLDLIKLDNSLTALLQCLKALIGSPVNNEFVWITC